MAVRIDDLEVDVKTNASSAAKEIDKLSSSLKSLKPSAEGSKKQMSKLSSVFKTFKKSKAGNLFSSIGRIAFYRAIRSGIKAVTTAVKEGTGNLYQYGKAMNSAFVQTLDSASTSVQYLKNGIAVGLAPIIQALTPMVVTAADAMADLGNAISEAFANANGKDTFTKAVKSFKEYQEAVDAAKSTTLGFDELNIIDNKNPISGMFEEVAVDSERAEQSMLKFQQILSGLGLVGIGGFSLKTLLGLKDAEVIDMDIGSIMLKAAGIGLTVSGGFDFITAVADAINNGGMSKEGDIASAIGLVKVGAGASLMTSNPIPIAIALVAQFGFTGKYAGNLVDELTKNINKPIQEWVNGIDSWFEGLELPPFLEALFKGNLLRVDANIFGQIGEGLSNALSGTLGAWYDLFHGDWGGWLENGKKAMKGIAEAFLAPIVSVINTTIDAINALTGSNIERIDWTSKASSIPTGEVVGPTLSGRTVDEELSYTMNGVPGELVDSGMGNASNSQNVNVYLDGKQIYNAIRKAEVRTGYKLVESGLTY